MDKKQCLHYKNGQCKFKTGICGSNKGNYICKDNGYPPTSMRQEKEQTYCRQTIN